MTAVRQATTVNVSQFALKQFTIPVYPHVRKFALKYFRQPDPIRVEEYSTLGKLVTLALRDNRAQRRGDVRWSGGDKLTASLTLILTKEQLELGPRLQKLIRINHDIDCMFKDELLSWIYALRAAGLPAQQACKMFLAHYNITEQEYSDDNAYRYYQRNKRP